jgi:hypothetical protein
VNCRRALDEMLTADPSALRGTPGGDLARHLAGCPRCAAVADALAAETRALEAGLRAFGHAGDPDAAARAALRAVGRGHPSEEVGPGPDPETIPGLGRGSPARRWARRSWVPLAAAAVAAWLLVADPFETPTPGFDPTAAPRRPEPTVAVTPPSGAGAAIWETADPNITIVWLYEKEGS